MTMIFTAHYCCPERRRRRRRPSLLSSISALVISCVCPSTQATAEPSFPSKVSLLDHHHHHHQEKRRRQQLSQARIAEDEVSFDSSLLDAESQYEGDLTDLLVNPLLENFKSSAAHASSRGGSKREDEIDSIAYMIPLSLSLSQPLPAFVSNQAFQSNSCRDQDEEKTFDRIPSHLLKSTGTTIAGVVCRDNCVVLGADTRATAATMVADKECHKIHCIIPSRVYACGAGTSGDLDAVTRKLHYTLKLQSMLQESIGNDSNNNNGTTTTTTTRVGMSLACRLLKSTLYKSRGGLGVNLIVGGIDNDGSAHLVAIHPHGSMDVVPYAALGSGGLAAMATLESRLEGDRLPTLEEAKELVKDAIRAGIQNDLGSGGHIDLCILGPNGEMQQERVTIASLGNRDETHLWPNRFRESNDDDDRIGANGFGSVPYKEQSRRELNLLSSDDIVKREWDNRLGLTNGDMEH